MKFLLCSSSWVIKNCYFIWKRGCLKGTEISYIWKVYRILIFYPILMCFFYIKWIVLSAFGSMSTDFLHQDLFVLLKFYFYGLRLHIESYVKMNIMFFLQILTSLNFEHKLHMNNQVSETDSGESLVYNNSGIRVA
jgi:hypothetical protein